MTPTIQQVIDTIVASVPGAPAPDSVDVFKSGDPSQPVRGIVTTFIATRQVIEQAIALGANLIITHEPTYFDHLDKAEWLQGDPVYEAKKRLIEQSGITIWRFHDYWHMHQPDGIATGFGRLMGWEDRLEGEWHNITTIPEMTLGDLAALLKSKLDMPTVRLVGDPGMIARRVVLLLGALPGQLQIEVFRQSDADVMVCGETTEWQTCEYVRDAAASGFNKGLIVLGHEKSEEPGMAYLVEWLKAKAPDVPITHVPAGDPLRFV